MMPVARMSAASEIRLDAKFRLDLKKRSCVIDAGTEVGRNIAKIFTGFITRQFGEGAFKVERTFSPQEAGRDPQRVGHPVLTRREARSGHGAGHVHS